MAILATPADQSGILPVMRKPRPRKMFCGKDGPDYWVIGVLMSDTAMSAALTRAGVVKPKKRLDEVAAAILRMDADQWAADGRPNWDDPAHRTKLLEKAMQAIKQNPRNWEGARDSLYKAIKGDAELLWALFEPYRAIATQKLLQDGAALLRDQERKVMEDNLNTARSRARNDAAPQDGRRSEPATGVTTTKSAPPAAPNLTAMADKQAARMATNIQVAIRMSMLDTFLVNGQKIGDLTPAEANAWAGARERDARFVRLLTANLPPDRPIREFRRGDEADELYQRAEAEHAA